MSEYEILDLVRQAENTVGVLLQWWGSVAFGVVALAHFASRKLNTLLVILVIFLFISFTGNTFSVMLKEFEQIAGYIDDLSEMQKNDVALASPTVQRIASRGEPAYGRLWTQVMTLGTFFGSVGYLVYRHICARKNQARRE